MSVIEFPKPTRDWRADELQQLVSLAEAARVSWGTGTTERGEPQFYVIGPAPDHDCMLCVSRLAQGYVLEDGVGRVIGEAPSLDRFAVAAARAAMRGSRSFVSRVMVAWITLRLTIEERLEPIVEESEEMLARYAPQIAAFI
jgi:hypothetical protein